MNVSGTPYNRFYNGAFIHHQQQQHRQENTDENVFFQLLHVSEELQKERINAQKQRQFYEVRLQELEDIITTIIRERDEARQQLFNMEELVRQQTFQEIQLQNNSNGGMGFAENEENQQNNSNEGNQENQQNNSNGGNQENQQNNINGGLEFEKNQQNNNNGGIESAENQQCTYSSCSSPIIDDDILKWLCPIEEMDFELILNKQEDHCQISADQHVGSSNLAEKETFCQQEHQQFENTLEQKQPQACDEQQPMESPMESPLDEKQPQAQQPVESPLAPLVEDSVTGNNLGQEDLKNFHGLRMLDIDPNAGGHMGYNHEIPAGLIPIHTSSMPLHLPEPPEMNVGVIMDKLPKQGHLLQAVMNAGPLLQTLLLSGPLPEWRDAPTSMGKLDIPRLSVESVKMIQTMINMDEIPPFVTAPKDPYIHPSSNLAATRNASDLQLMYQAGSSSSQQAFKPAFGKERGKLFKFRPTSKPYQGKNAYPNTQNIFR